MIATCISSFSKSASAAVSDVPGAPSLKESAYSHFLSKVTPELTPINLLATVNEVADAIAETLRVSPPIVIKSQTVSSVSKYVVVPVTVVESAAVATVPIICDAGCEYAERAAL